MKNNVIEVNSDELISKYHAHSLKKIEGALASLKVLACCDNSIKSQIFPLLLSAYTNLSNILWALSFQNDGNSDEHKDAEEMSEDVYTSLAYYVEGAIPNITYKERKKLPSTDFVDIKRRSFPINNPDSVRRAVNSWGRYKGDMSFEEFKKRLIEIAKRKGPEYVAQLPEEWKKDLK